MGLTSFKFLCFFAVLLLVYYSIPKRWQWKALLFASIAFFLISNTGWLILYPALAVMIAYLGTYFIEQMKEQKQKRMVLSSVVVLIVLMLGVLKYANFGIYTYNAVASRITEAPSYLPLFRFLVPLGISFYTLSILGYVFDVYYGIGKREDNIGKLALFGFYFPTIISGPITRYSAMEKEFFAEHRLNYREITFGMQRILWGFFKKLVISERLAIIVNTVYNDYEAYPGTYIFLATICFAFQLYTDFSGAMDIVIGVSQTLGIKVEENFKTPFFSGSIQEFWRRWHITLGAWFKDYLLFPLLRTTFFMQLTKRLQKKTKKKVSKMITTFVAMFILWFTVGLWHNGSWRYIVGSGILHWIYIVIGEITKPFWDKFKVRFSIKKENKYLVFVQRMRTFLLVCGGFLFFRSSSFTDGCSMYRVMFSSWNPEILWNGAVFTLGLNWVEIVITTVSLGMLLAVSILQQKISIRAELAKKCIVIRWIIYFALLFYVILLGYYGPGFSATEFIYQGF